MEFYFDLGDLRKLLIALGVDLENRRMGGEK
jgi:hypothetical protein